VHDTQAKLTLDDSADTDLGLEVCFADGAVESVRREQVSLSFDLAERIPRAERSLASSFEAAEKVDTNTLPLLPGLVESTR
jgi:hypothetical protein